MKNAEILNDLVEINNDRVAGYEKAAEQAKDADLIKLFKNMSEQSRVFVNELKEAVKVLGQEPAEGTTVRGKIYRTWMDIKKTFSGSNRKSLLESCEYGEDAAQKAYNNALDETSLSAAERNLLIKQKAALLSSHNKVRELRDKQLV